MATQGVHMKFQGVQNTILLMKKSLCSGSVFEITVKPLIQGTPYPKTWIFFVSSCSCLCQIHWSQVLSWEWRCSWNSADRRCFNYIWVINKFIVYQGVSYIRDLTVVWNCFQPRQMSCQSSHWNMSVWLDQNINKLHAIDGEQTSCST